MLFLKREILQRMYSWKASLEVKFTYVHNSTRRISREICIKTLVSDHPRSQALFLSLLEGEKRERKRAWERGWCQIGISISFVYSSYLFYPFFIFDIIILIATCISSVR
jgi:hypothetical protein